jgi:hypothetical protein
VPSGLEMIPQENGIMQMIESRKTSSPLQFECASDCPHHQQQRHYHHS